jgi:hypothetical protein
MRKRLSEPSVRAEPSLRGQRVFFSSKPEPRARQCGRHRQFIDCAARDESHFMGATPASFESALRHRPQDRSSSLTLRV